MGEMVLPRPAVPCGPLPVLPYDAVNSLGRQGCGCAELWCVMARKFRNMGDV